jgi:hypothetical protein
MDGDANREVTRAVQRLNARAWGIAGGLVLGMGLLVATNILVLRGAPPGQEVGPHLALLRYFFPGYSVTFLGSLLGFVYGFVTGYALGRGVGSVYNRLVDDFPH